MFKKLIKNEHFAPKDKSFQLKVHSKVTTKTHGSLLFLNSELLRALSMKMPLRHPSS